jgi:hypothetical protein
MEKIYCGNCEYCVFDYYKNLSNKCKHPNFHKKIPIDTSHEQKIKITYGNTYMNKNNDCKYYKESNYIYYDRNLYKRNGYLHNCIKQGKDPHIRQDIIAGFILFGPIVFIVCVFYIWLFSLSPH